MKNIKFVAVFSVCGFILSFLFGLFSHTHLIIVLLKALLFGVVFGGLGFGISFVSHKFLSEDGGSVTGIDVEMSTGNAKTSESQNQKGQLVNISIRDEELPLGVSDNHYVVGESHQMLNENDYGHLNQNSQAQTSVAPDPNVSFKPVRNLETLTNVSSKESVTPESIAANSNVSQSSSNVSMNNSNSDEGIDTLPDISAFAMENISSSSEDEAVSDVDTDSGSEFVTTATRSLSSDAEVPEIKDASLFAKAISSVLSAEDN